MHKIENYNPLEHEKLMQEFWETEKVYAFDPNSKKTIYSIDTPPPTVSGKMHIGHAFSYTQQDIIARYHRMKGESVFYPFGTDDNGLATERLIEKLKNVKGSKMARKEFVDLCLKTLETIRPQYVQDWKNIGLSADFSIFYTTIDQHCQKVSQQSFLDLYKMGRIYRKKAPIMVCPTCQTAIAQVELKDVKKPSHLVHIEVSVEGGEKVVFATTRPELLPACVGISVHPQDKRYKHLIGKKVTMPLTGAKVPLSPDEATDMEYGSGVVYYCTYGGVECIDWLTRHPEAKPIHIMGLDGRFTDGKYRGMKSEEARKQVIEDLRASGALVQLEKIHHTVNTHERCETDIEFVATEQWFIKYLDLKSQLVEAGKKLQWYPSHFISRYTNWIEGLRWDWCISRQRFFGVPFPLWYCKKCAEVKLAEQLPVDPLNEKPQTPCKCGSREFTPENDVMDTWATSSLTPELAANLFRDHPVYKKLLPMSLRPQAHDIITFWLFNTVVKSQFHHKQNPWKDVMISGWALDPHGKKMSKSKGNVVEPQVVVEKYGADALRFWAAGSKLGDDLPYQEKDILTGKKFVTKLWNAAKFAFIHLGHYNGDVPKNLQIMDAWILSKLQKLIRVSTEAFENYEYSRVKGECERFFQHDFCDNYLEIIKDRMYNPGKRGEDAALSAKYTVYVTLLTVLRLMAPIIPYSTEAVFQTHFAKNQKEKSVHLCSWPQIDKKQIDDKLEHAGELALDIIATVRRYKSEKQLSLKAPLQEIIIGVNKEQEKLILDALDDLKAVCGAQVIGFGKASTYKTATYGIGLEIVG